ncbi:MAG: hypothetical protein IKY00_05860 [Clostridia bacterium]|nr:hypothetical protein [Clostridia bacterium]
MDNKDLFETIGGIDEDYIAQSENYHFKKRHNILKFALPIAACLVLFFGGFAVSRVTLGSKKAADTVDYKDYNGNYQKEAADAENAVETCKDEQAESAECSVREVSDSEAKAFFEKNADSIIQKFGPYDSAGINLSGYYHVSVNENGTPYLNVSERYYLVTINEKIAGTAALYYDGDELKYEINNDKDYASALNEAFGEYHDGSLIFADYPGGSEVIVTSANNVYTVKGNSPDNPPDYESLYVAGGEVPGSIYREADYIRF